MKILLCKSVQLNLIYKTTRHLTKNKLHWWKSHRSFSIVYWSILLDEMIYIKMHNLLCLFAVLLDCCVLLIDLTGYFQELILKSLEISMYHLPEIANARNPVCCLLQRIHHPLCCAITSLEAAEYDVLQLLMYLIFHFLEIVRQRVWYWNALIHTSA